MMSRTSQVHTLVLELIKYSLISSGENSVLVSAARVSIFSSTRQPLLLGEEKQRGLKSWPDTSTYDLTVEIEPLTCGS